MEIKSSSPKATQKIAQVLAKKLKGGNVVALFGDLGSGKTVFVKGLARGLGIKKRITSPTFIFMRSYDYKSNGKPLTFYHLDLYRAQNIDDLKSLGLAEIFAKDSIVVLEWADKIKNKLSEKRIDVEIKTISENERLIKITKHNYSSSDPERLARESRQVSEASEILKSGGVVIFPTDTVYGIGCRFDDQKAIDRIYKIKDTPKLQPFPILVSKIDQVKKLAKTSKTALNLMSKYWPGGLTIILPSIDPVSRQENNVARYGIVPGHKLGFRMPDSRLVSNLIQKVGKPIIGTSANFHGQPPPKSYQELDPNFTKLADFVVIGECKLGQESTVVDATVDPPRILRQGAVAPPLSS